MNTKNLTVGVYRYKMCFKAHLHREVIGMDKTIQALRDAGGVMTFEEFMDAARSNKEPGALWLRLKHAGVIETFINANGVLSVRVPAVDSIPF